jgi:hypothetical protein
MTDKKNSAPTALAPAAIEPSRTQSDFHLRALTVGGALIPPLTRSA